MSIHLRPGLVQETDLTQWKCHWYIISEHRSLDIWRTCHSMWSVCPSQTHGTYGLLHQPHNGSTFDIFITGETVSWLCSFKVGNMKITGCQYWTAWRVVLTLANRTFAANCCVTCRWPLVQKRITLSLKRHIFSWLPVTSISAWWPALCQQMVSL